MKKFSNPRSGRLKAKLPILIPVSILLLACAASLTVIWQWNRDVQERFATHNIPRFYIVASGIMRGGEPSKEGLMSLKNYYKVKTVLDLRGKKQHNEREKDFVKKLGMEPVNVPMSSQEEQGIEKIERILNIITDKSKQPIFVHCQAGKDRTGLVMAAYRIKYNNWSFKRAYEEMLSFGYDTRFEKLEESLIEWNDYVQKK